MINLDYLYNPNAAKGLIDKNYFIDKKLGFQVIEHGMILPPTVLLQNNVRKSFAGGVVDGNGEYIKESSIHYGIGAKYTPPRISFVLL